MDVRIPWLECSKNKDTDNIRECLSHQLFISLHDQRCFCSVDQLSKGTELLDELITKVFAHNMHFYHVILKLVDEVILFFTESHFNKPLTSFSQLFGPCLNIL